MRPPPRAFRDHVALVTGASAGIGAALARELARQGADLALLARRTGRLEAVAEDVRRLGRQVLVASCDVTSDDDVRRAIAESRTRFGRLDIVVANAGFSVSSRVEHLSVADVRRQLETNLFGVLRTVHATLPDLRQTRGRLAVLGSIAGYMSAPGMAAYAMSKYAVRALAESLHEELRGTGVSVTLVSPGFVESEIRRVDRAGVFRPERPDPVPAWLVVGAEAAARSIAGALAARRREVIVTGHGKVLVWLARHAPWLLRPLLRAAAARRERRVQLS